MSAEVEEHPAGRGGHGLLSALSALPPEPSPSPPSPPGLASSSSPPPPPPPVPRRTAWDPLVVEAMTTGTLRDKQVLLQAEAEMSRFLASSSPKYPLGPALSTSLNSYQRMLVHRLADSFGIRRTLEFRQLLLERTPLSTCPAVRLESLMVRQDASPSNADPNTTPRKLASDRSGAALLGSKEDQPLHGSPSQLVGPGSCGLPKTFKIMSRSPSQRSTSRVNSKNALSSAASPVSSADGTQSDSKRSELTYEARQAAYLEARNRIFAKSSENGPSGNGMGLASSPAPGADEEGFGVGGSTSDGKSSVMRTNSQNSLSSEQLTRDSHGASAVARANGRAASSDKPAPKLRPSATSFDPSAKAHGYEEVTIIEINNQAIPCDMPNHFHLGPLSSFHDSYTRDPCLTYSNPHKAFQSGPFPPPPPPFYYRPPPSLPPPAVSQGGPPMYSNGPSHASFPPSLPAGYHQSPHDPSFFHPPPGWCPREAGGHGAIGSSRGNSNSLQPAESLAPHHSPRPVISDSSLFPAHTATSGPPPGEYENCLEPPRYNLNHTNPVGPVNGQCGSTSSNRLGQAGLSGQTTLSSSTPSPSMVGGPMLEGHGGFGCSSSGFGEGCEVFQPDHAFCTSACQPRPSSMAPVTMPTIANATHLGPIGGPPPSGGSLGLYMQHPQPAGWCGDHPPSPSHLRSHLVTSGGPPTEADPRQAPLGLDGGARTPNGGGEPVNCNGGGRCDAGDVVEAKLADLAIGRNLAGAAAAANGAASVVPSSMTSAPASVEADQQQQPQPQASTKTLVSSPVSRSYI